MRYLGVVTGWSDRGYGFLLTEDRRQFFLHIHGMIDQSILPQKGDVIEFEARESSRNKLPEAMNAVIISTANAEKVELKAVL